MHEEAFLQAIRERPDDETTLLVYADWLEEQDETVCDARAELLRLSVRGSKAALNEQETKRLQALAAALEPEWLGVVSRLAVENCADAKKGRLRVDWLGLRCGRKWEDMQ